MFIGSEVYELGDVLSVRYAVWTKQCVAERVPQPNVGNGSGGKFQSPKNCLKVVWRPHHQFSSGRVAMVAVAALLNQGYTIEVLKPEKIQK